MRLLIGNSVRTITWAIAIIVISTLAATVVMWRAPALKLAARDALVRARGTATPPDEVVIVAIDEASVKRFGRFPWPRRLMAQALDKLSGARPKVIAIHTLYSDTTNEADDAALAEAVKRAGNVVVASQLIETQLGGAEWLRPLPAIEKAAAAVGHGNVLTDFDGVARSLNLRQTDDEGHALWAMAVEVIRVGDGLIPDDARDVPGAVKIGSRLIPVEEDAEDEAYATRGAENSPQTFRAGRMAIDYIGPAGSFAGRTMSIADVIDGRAEPEKLNGKYVLIGVTAAAMGDRVVSPFAAGGDRRGALTPGVEVSANAVTTVLRSRYYRETPDWVAAVFAALVAAAVVGALILAQGRREFIKQIAALLGIAAMILFLSYLAFARWMITPPIVSTLASLIVAAPLALLLRSLMVSASLDDRIAEMTRESARLSPFAIDNKAVAAKPAWWPRGTSRKARALAALQERLLARTQFVDRALQSVEDGLLIADAAGRIAFVNPRAAEILGLGERSLLGGNLFDRLAEIEYGADKPATDRTMSRLLEDRVVIEREIVVGAAEPRYYTLRMAAVSDDSGGSGATLGVVATLSDITKQRELQRMQNDVMQLVTHEMKTPLTAIKGMSEVMMKFDPGAEKRHEMSAAINEATGRMTRMIDDYLDLTRLESGAREPRLAWRKVESLIEQNLLLLDPVAARRGVMLIRKFAPDMPPIFADADLLARALTNLVANAIKYSPANTDVLVSVRAGEDNLFIAVADQGYGIPLEHQASIFEKFFRVPRVEDAETPGTGLGLALVREIAELHGGRVTVESEVGAGSIFTLRLPLNRKPI
jgi:PAS domain S-box-containing protein